MSIYPTVPLTDVAWFQEGPGILARDFTSEGIPLVRLSGLGGHEVTLRACNHVSQDKGSSKWAHFRLSKGDILVSTSASFGRPAVVGEEADGALFYTGLIRFRSKSPDLDEGYLKTFLGSRLFMRQAEAMASGSVIQHFGPSHLRKMHVHLPPLSVQQSIASIHAALDDKVESNRRLSVALEKLALSVFSDWFVDFGPTRAKMAGAEAYLADDVWALFPDCLNEEKPEGWRGLRLGDVATLGRHTLSPGQSPEQAFEHFSLPAYDVDQNPAIELGGSIRSNKSVVPSGSVLLSKLNPDISRVWLPEAATDLPQIASTEFLPLIPFGNVGRSTIYTALKSNPVRASLQGLATGTSKSHQRVSPLSALDTCLGVFSDPLLHVYETFSTPLLERVLSFRQESRALIALRDFVLPGLMSGKVQVHDAERIIAEAA